MALRGASIMSGLFIESGDQGITTPCAASHNIDVHSRLVGTDSQDVFQSLPNGRALSHLDLASKPERVADVPIPGFTLLSVKRTSKFRHHRTRSVSSLTSTRRLRSDDLTDSNTNESSRGDSSRTSSQSALDEDDFDASGSIEAEEFEDDEADDYEGVNEDDGAFVLSQQSVVSNPLVSASFVLPNKVPRYRNHVHRLIPDSTTDHCNGQFPSGFKEPVNSNLFSQPSNVQYPLESAVTYRKRRHLLPGQFVRYYKSYKPYSYEHPCNIRKYHPAHLQTNMSHFIPGMNSAHPASGSPVHTTASDQPLLSFSSFPPPVIETSISAPFNVNSSPHSNSTPVHYSHYTRPPLSCPHHLHPVTGSSEHHTAQNSQLSDEVSVGAATIPPLQPASRFRKARIHETVEQWCHTRASVHDCRLKTVPDRVTELQKKSCILEMDVSSAVGERLHCFSCFCVDPGLVATNDSTSLTVPVKTRATSVCAPSQDQLPMNCCGSLMEISHDRGWPLTDLLSIWTNGSRTECFLSNLLPLDPHLDVDTSFANSANQSAADCCSLCAEPLHDTMSAITYRKRASTADHNPSVLDCSGEILRHAERNHPLPTDALSTTTQPYNSVDPATSYLRHYHQDTDFKQHLTVCPGLVVQRGDNPLTTVHQLSPDVATFSSLSCSHSQDDSHPTLPHTESLDGTMRLLPNHGQPFNPTTVPPTSPMSNCTNLESDHNPFGFISALHDPNLSTVQLLVNGVVSDQRTTAAAAPTYENQGVYLRQRVGSGSYHNVSQLGQSPCSDDFYLYNNATSLPPSPSDVAVRFPFDSQIQTGYGSIPVRTDQNGSGATPPTPRPSTTASHKGLPLDHQVVEDNGQVSTVRKRFSVDSIETRVEASLGVIRSLFDNAFRNELTAIHSENVSLLVEVERLNREVTSLQKFRDAFFALRRVVPAELWEHCIMDQQNPTQTNLPDSTLSAQDRHPARPNSPNSNGAS